MTPSRKNRTGNARLTLVHKDKYKQAKHDGCIVYDEDYFMDGDTRDDLVEAYYMVLDAEIAPPAHRRTNIRDAKALLLEILEREYNILEEDLHATTLE